MNSNRSSQVGVAVAQVRRRNCGFTLVEVMVSVAILAMIMAIVTQVLGQAQRSWKAASSRVTQFAEARQAFDTVTRNLRQASLPTYYDWAYNEAGTQMVPDKPTDKPVQPVKRADLGFQNGPTSAIVTGGGSPEMLPGHAVIFQAPMGYTVTPAPAGGGALNYDQLTRLLCARGYFVRFSSDASFIPAGLTGRLEDKHRFRLFEYRPPTELNPVFSVATPGIAPDGGTAPQGSWMTIDASRMEAGGGPSTSPGSYIRPVAENILMLAFAVSFSAPTGVDISSLSHPASSSKESVPFFSAYNSYTGAATGSSSGLAPGANRLPRAVEVLMVAVDEESATKMASKYGNSAPPVISRSGASFSKTSDHDADVNRLRQALVDEKLNFRIFNTIILLPASDT